MTATVVRIERIEKHPNADNLELLHLSNDVTVVAGQHYETLQLGVYISPGSLLPGYLAEDMWLVKKGDNWVKVEDRIMRGVESPGIFAGAYYRNSNLSPTQPWPMWRKRWTLGLDVSAFLGIVGGSGRGSSTSEHGVSNAETGVQLAPLAPSLHGYLGHSCSNPLAEECPEIQHTYEVLADLHEQASGHKCSHGCDSPYPVNCNCQGKCDQHQVTHASR